jgi:two-component system, NarL family, sensor histidine kinase DesK
MADDGARVVSPRRLAWAIPLAFLCLLLPARAGVAVGYGYGATGAGVVVALFAT